MVTPFYKTGDSWTAQNSFVPPDNIPGIRFGYRFEASSNELLMFSATRRQAPPEGFTTIITMGCFWALVGSFYHRMFAAGNRFGSVIVIDRNRAYISSHTKMLVAMQGAGKVYVYFFNGTSWVWEANSQPRFRLLMMDLFIPWTLRGPIWLLGVPKKSLRIYWQGAGVSHEECFNNWYLLNTFPGVAE